MTRLLLALLLLSGCSVKPDRIALDATVGISPDFSAEQTESVLAAASAWQAATGGRFAPTLRLGDCGGCTLRIHPGAAAGAAASTEIGADDRADMTVDLRLSNMAAIQDHEPSALVLQDTVMHELGHAFGLEHEPDTLMRATGFGGAAVDSVTLERFSANY